MTLNPLSVSRTIALVVSLSATATACVADGEPAPAPADRSRATTPSGVRPLEVVEPGEVPADIDGFSLGEIAIDENVLEVTVSFGGGCEAHDFRLFWDGRVLETFPAQIRLALIHDGHGDACEAFLTRKLRFDLAAIAALDPGEVKLGIRGGGASKSVSFAPLAILPLQVVSASSLPKQGDDYFLQGAVINGNHLGVTVSYGGGCSEHEFELFWNGLVMESFPPQVNLMLHHQAHGDACEAFLTRKLQFDLATLGAQVGTTVVVHLGTPQEEETLTFAPPRPTAE